MPKKKIKPKKKKKTKTDAKKVEQEPSFDEVIDEIENDDAEDSDTISLEMENAINLFKELDGVGPSTARILCENGKYTLESLIVLTAKELSADTGIGENTCSKIITSARKFLNVDFKLAIDILNERSKIKRFTTGSSELDALIGGGIEPKVIYEFYGEFRTGKTQICHQACITVQLPEEHGGINGSALYIDAEGTFRPERLVQIVKNRYAEILDPDDVLKRIVYARAYSSDHQYFIIEKIPELIKSNKDLKLVVIDSIISHFRAEYLGRGTLSDRQQKLNRQIHLLQKVADSNNLTIFMTNQVMSSPGIMFGDPTRPIGGHVIAHASAYRLYLRKSKSNLRVVKLIDSPSLPEGEVALKITDSGVEDS